jgi:hypothetical protein
LDQPIQLAASSVPKAMPFRMLFKLLSLLNPVSNFIFALKQQQTLKTFIFEAQETRMPRTGTENQSLL